MGQAPAVAAARESPIRPKRRVLLHGALALVGVALSATLVATAFFRVGFDGGLHLTPRFHLGGWIHDLPSHLPWVLGFAALTASILPLRALQWRYTLGDREVPFSHRYHSVAIGAFVHNAIPGKLGEFMRAWLLARREKFPFVQSLGSVLVCKLLEFAALLVVVAVGLAGPLGRNTGHLGKAMVIAAPICVGLLGLVFAGAHFAMPIERYLERREKLPRLRVLLLNLGEGFGAARRPRHLAMAFLASFGPVLAAALAYGVALQALGVPNGIVSGVIVLGAIALGQLTPGLPIGLGMYYLLSSWAARALGASESQAAALSVLTHFATFGTNLLVGLVSLLSQKMGLKELLRGKRAVMEASRHVAEAAHAAVPPPVPGATR